MESSLGREDSEEEQPASSASGIEAIFSHSSFSNRASSIYLYSLRSYLDTTHSSAIHEHISQPDPNLLYSLNASALCLLLKDKLKRLGKVQLFDNSSDKIVLKFTLLFAGYLALNDGKEKVMEKERQPLRKDLREYLQGKIRKEAGRKVEILQEFTKSPFFNSRIAEELSLNAQQREDLRNRLVNFSFERTPTLVSFLQRCLNYIQKCIQRREAQSRKGSQASSGIQQGGITREAYSALLLCNYLNLYIVVADWLKILLNDKQKRLQQLVFCYISQQKGYHVINRVLDDAPLNAIGQEIKAFQANFYK